MLTAEILKASTALSGLTDEQVAAITTLSKNDEDTVIGQKIGKIWGDIDRDIEEVTGLEKPKGVKTFDWMKNDILTKVGSSSKLQKKLDKLKTEKEELEQQLKDGKVDEALTKKLADNEKLVKDLQSQLTTKENEYTTKLAEAEDRNVGILVNNEFDKSLVGVKFKDEAIIPKNIRDTVISTSKQAILAENKPDWIDDGKGGKQLVFRDDKGEIRRNPENNLNPFTAKELFLSKITDVVDAGKQQAGAGSKGGGKGSGGSGNSALSLTDAKTQVEADDRITDYLMGKGLVRGTEEYNKEFNEIRTDNNVSDLELR